MSFSNKRIKRKKAYGSLSKYANKSVASKERDIIAKAMVDKYVKIIDTNCALNKS